VAVAAGCGGASVWVGVLDSAGEAGSGVAVAVAVSVGLAGGGDARGMTTAGDGIGVKLGFDVPGDGVADDVPLAAGFGAGRLRIAPK
jgi:hypothetical protein